MFLFFSELYKVVKGIVEAGLEDSNQCHTKNQEIAFLDQKQLVAHSWAFTTSPGNYKCSERFS